MKFLNLFCYSALLRWHINLPFFLSTGFSLILAPPLSNPSLSADGTWTTTYWPLHTPHKREILELNANFSRIVNGHRVKKCAFWKKFLPRLTSLGKSDEIIFMCSRISFP